MITAQQLKQVLLDRGEEVLKEYIDATLGIKEPKSLNAGCRTEVWDLLKQLILRSSDVIKLEAGSPEGILAAVEKGQLTTESAKQLLSMYQQVKTINQTHEDGKGGMVFNVMIQGSSVENKDVAIEIERSDSDSDVSTGIARD